MSDFELGRHEAQIQGLTDRCARIEITTGAMDAKLDSIVATLAERRGERHTIATIAAVAGGFGSVLVTVLLKLFVK